mmetsp:Transcript_20761/g.41161  ORF Transcript_20761/g.41161 Transcript_20761/m.41161 type:complete len:219 (-) Transcript_20761:149-805(-)
MMMSSSEIKLRNSAPSVKVELSGTPAVSCSVPARVASPSLSPKKCACCAQLEGIKSHKPFTKDPRTGRVYCTKSCQSKIYWRSNWTTANLEEASGERTRPFWLEPPPSNNATKSRPVRGVKSKSFVAPTPPPPTNIDAKPHSLDPPMHVPHLKKKKGPQKFSRPPLLSLKNIQLGASFDSGAGSPLVPPAPNPELQLPREPPAVPGPVREAEPPSWAS